MSELEEIKRIEKVLLLTWKLAKAVMRTHNRTTKIFNGNFDIFEENVNRNAQNIDKMVNTIQDIMGTNPDEVLEKSENYDTKHMYL